MMSWRIPAVLKQRFQHSFPVSRSDLLLVNHLVDHLLSDAGQGPLLTVKNCHTLTEEHVGRHSERIMKKREQCGYHYTLVITV